MKIQEPCKTSKKFLTNKVLKFVVFVAIISVFARALLSLQYTREVKTALTQKTVIKANDRIIIDRTIFKDTINITITKFRSDTVIIKEDTRVLDTITKKL